MSDRPEWQDTAAKLAADHMADGDTATARRILDAATARIDAEVEAQRSSGG